MPQFKQGSTGPSVRKLQALLNVTSGTGLVVDGMFGPRTREAVIAYQRAAHLRPDGIVGIQTLASLAFADPNKPLPLGPAVEFGSSAPGGASRPGAASAPGATPAPAASGARPPPRPVITAASQRPINIHEWPTKDVIIEVLKRTGDHLGPDLRTQWNQLISPASLEMMAGTMILVLAAHAVGVGEAADVIMLGIGVLYLGSSAIDGAKELGAFLATVAQAATPRDLDGAADHLAKAIVILGITAVMAWLLKRSLRGAGGEAEGAAAAEDAAEPKARPPANEEPAPRSEPKPPAPKRAPNLRADLDQRWLDTEGNPRWPPDRGFAEPPVKTTLEPGMRFDRYGRSSGTFLSDAGTPYGNRALPYDPQQMPYHAYEVVKPLPVESGKIAPWFDRPRGGTQYVTGKPIQQLIDEGYLKEVTP